MRVALVVAASKYTGAAAVAEHCARALRAVEVEATLLYLAGRNLEDRLADAPWARAGLVKGPGPAALRANLAAIRTAASSAHVVVCHLPHDHFLAVLAGAHRRARLVRAFRNSGHLRLDPVHRALTRRCFAALLAHSELAPALERHAPGLPWAAPPVPIEDRFAPGADPSVWRRRLAIPAHAPVLGMVGKVAAGRGFDLLVETAARIGSDLHVLAVGHGEAQIGVESLARRLGVAGRLRWAGYHESELPALYAAMDVVLYPAVGSDHGHRAISEAQACGRPVVAADLEGVRTLVEDGRSGLVAAGDPGALAAAAARLLNDRQLAAAATAGGLAASAARRFGPVGRELAAFLGQMTSIG